METDIRLKFYIFYVNIIDSIYTSGILVFNKIYLVKHHLKIAN